MKIFVTGASGLVGTGSCEELTRAGHEVVGLSRGRREDGAVRWLQGDPGQPGAWTDEAVRADAVVHLAGEPVASGRWTKARKRELVRSRVESTRALVDALRRSSPRPRVLVSASACGYYGARGEEALAEDASPGSDFLASLCVDWEAEARAAAALDVRVVCLRFGVILSRRGGALATMLPIFRLGLGGPLGPGGSFFPWVSEMDAFGLIAFALEHEALSGPVNVVAPEPARMGEFARTLGRVLRRPAVLPVPTLVLRVTMGEMGGSLTPGQKVIPEAATRAGYVFREPTLDSALQSLLRTP